MRSGLFSKAPSLPTQTRCSRFFAFIVKARDDALSALEAVKNRLPGLSRRTGIARRSQLACGY